jgi:pyrimidine-nucleoside phosphorylase
LTLLANGAADGSIPDYQLAAWLMAAYLKPLTDQETAWLTTAMADSGKRLDLTGLPKPWVDKHSTGGVGDKTTIVLLPVFAACGLTVIKMSGRGLGITGGTVDKLASIPGFRLDLSPDELKDQARAIGLALTGQTPDLAPADKALYALRDVTATVGSVPLIVSSILSKKLAGGAETVILDVKCGKGGFMRTFEQARELAEALDRTAQKCGLNIRIAITDMDQPLGSAVGNALEIKEAIRVLSGEQSRFADHCVQLAGLTLEASGLQRSREVGEATALEAISSGRALEKARQWFRAQGAIVDVTGDPGVLPQAPVVNTLLCEQAGWINSIDASAVGLAALTLGGGRRTKDDTIDYSVGVELHVEVGSAIAPGQPLITIHAQSDAAASDVSGQLLSAIEVSTSEIAKRKPVLLVL